MDLTKEADAVLLGPGLIDEVPVAELRSEILGGATESVFILDATAFSSLRRPDNAAPVHRRRMIATPHSGEMAKFLQSARTKWRLIPVRLQGQQRAC